MHEMLFDHVDILPENIHIPDGTVAPEKAQAYCEEYERQIAAVGGIDLQLLGIGRSGHIGFNEPGSSIKSRTRPIYLDQVTRKDAASDFFGGTVPLQAITMGVGTILAARRLVMMAFGEGKAAIVRRAIEEPISETVAASQLQVHPNATVFLDVAAAAGLSCLRCPWLLAGGSSLVTVDFTPEMVRKAVIWLALEVKKPILRLEDDDYRTHHLSQLLDLHNGRTHEINLSVYHHLHRGMTGWPGGRTAAHAPATAPLPHPTLPREHTNYDPSLATHKRVLIFSPHPDDDVISMGGTMIRLCDQGHEVHAAYQTSGNIAVFDDDAVRYCLYVIDHLTSLGITGQPLEAVRAQVARIQDHIAHKCGENGWIDSPELLLIKANIRKNEATSAAVFCGVLLQNVHFLNLPFYQTGTVKKNPITDADVKIVLELLRKVKPQQIYAAGDLSDPHGTHRMCLKALLRAIELCKEDEWYKECQVWLYRGAWQEWEPEKVEMSVPMSPDELYRKRLAIFRHQSQKDPPPFPGADPREFWQRSEARNRATAKLFDQLGLPEFEALETFVRYDPQNLLCKALLS